jgi:hypothetical protein
MNHEAATTHNEECASLFHLIIRSKVLRHEKVCSVIEINCTYECGEHGNNEGVGDHVATAE